MGSMVAFTPTGFGVPGRGGMRPAQGLQARTCCSAGADGGKPRGVSPGAAAALASSLPAADRASAPARCGHRRRGTSLSPGRGGDRQARYLGEDSEGGTRAKAQALTHLAMGQPRELFPSFPV